MPLRFAHSITLRGLPCQSMSASTGNLRRVPVELVVRRELIVPLQLARIGIERDHRAAVQVVARPSGAVPVRSGIAGAPVGEVRLGIVRTGHPDRRAAVHPRVAAPRFVARLAWPGHGVEAPHFFAGLHVPRGDEAADAELTAGGSGDHFVLHDERRHGERVAVLRIAGRLGLPQLLARSSHRWRSSAHRTRRETPCRRRSRGRATACRSSFAPRDPACTSTPRSVCPSPRSARSRRWDSESCTSCRSRRAA